MKDPRARTLDAPAAGAPDGRIGGRAAPLAFAAALAAALVAPLDASADAFPPSPPDAREVELRAVGAPLPLVLRTLAGTLDVELLIDESSLAPPPLLFETYRGDAADAMERLVERFELALFVDGPRVWIDGPGYRHVHAIAVGARDPAALASAVEPDLASAGGRIESVAQELVLSGPRAAVVGAVRSLALTLARTLPEPEPPEEMPQEPAPEGDTFDVGAPGGAPVASGGEAVPDGSIAPAPGPPSRPVAPPVTPPAATSTSEPAVARPEPVPESVPAIRRDAPRRIDDVRKVPGFDSEYER